MADNNLNNQRNEEIDLLDLFNRMGRSIGRFFNCIGRGILISIMFLIRKWLPLSLSILIGIAVSFIFKTVLPPVYQADMVLRTNIVPAAEMIPYINKLHDYSKEKNTVVLASSLSIPQEIAKQIVDISAYWIVDMNHDSVPDYVDYRNRHNAHDTIDVLMRNRLDIRIQTRTAQELSSVKSGITGFINNNPFFRQRNDMRLQQNQELLTRLSYDILQLDSLQKVKYFEETRNRIPKTGGQIVFLQEQKTQLIYNDIYFLYARKQSIEAQQALYKDIVTLISDLTIPFKPITGVLNYGKVIIPVFFILTLLMLIIVKNMKNLKDILHRH